MKYNTINNIGNVKMSIQELTAEEVEHVSGAFLGNVLIGTANVFNNFLNTRLISAVGEGFSAIGLGAVHQLADTTGLIASKTLVSVGQAIGGTLPVAQNHYDKESAAGLYLSLIHI